MIMINQTPKPPAHLSERSKCVSPRPKHLEMRRPGSGITPSKVLRPIQLNGEEHTHFKPPMPTALLAMNLSSSEVRMGQRGQSANKSLNKLGNSSDLETSIKELKQRMYRIGKTLFQHERLINDLRESKLSSSTSVCSTEQPFTVPAIPTLTDISKRIQQEIEFQRQNLHKTVTTAIDEVRREISDKLVRREEFPVDLQEIRNRMHEGDRKVAEALRMEIDSLKLINYESIRSTNSRFDKQVMEIRENIQSLRSQDKAFRSHLQQIEEQHKPMVSSSHCFKSPRLIKYRQTLQAMSSETDKIGQEITVNQIIYYLDRDGFLLDKNHYYLVDLNNNPIQLEQKHLNLLYKHNMMH